MSRHFPERMALEWMALAGLAATGLAVAVLGSGYIAQSLFNMAMLVLLSVGWNIISGLTGYVSFGQVSFFGLGAYVAAISLQSFDIAWYQAAGLAAVAAALLALPLGMIMLRLSGIFFALGMFGLARILQIIANEMSITGGPMGSTVPAADSPNLAAFVMVCAAALAVAATFGLTRSKLGLRLMAVRDDAVAAQAAGVDVWRAKIVAFCASACLAGLAGGLYAWDVGYIDPNSTFQGTIELQCVLMVLAGGIGTVWGPVIGGVAISILSTMLWARFPMEQQIILGALTIFIAVAMPGGLMSLANRRGWLKRAPIWGPPGSEPGLRVLGAEPAVANDDGRPVLDCRRLSVNFGGVTAVNDVRLVARSGETLAIVGPNGAGKSTLFNLISSFLKPTSGEVLLEGRQVGRLAPHLLARGGIARTFQTSRLFPSLCVWETVLLAACSVHPRKADAIAATSRILAEVELLELWDSLPDTLPPGRQRLLEIARALVLRPRVLLLDEAMAGMTMTEIGRVHLALRKAMADGCAVVAIEHVLPAIAELARRVQVLDFGATIAEGPPAEVLASPVVVEAYMGAEFEEEARA